MSSEYRIRKVYQWKEVTDDGRLLDPMDRWGYPLFSDYDSEENAEKAYKDLLDRDHWQYPFELILVTSYRKQLNPK